MAKEQLTIVKIGGDIVDNDVLLEKFFQHIKEVNGPKIIVHGGGNKASSIQRCNNGICRIAQQKAGF